MVRGTPYAQPTPGSSSGHGSGPAGRAGRRGRPAGCRCGRGGCPRFRMLRPCGRPPERDERAGEETGGGEGERRDCRDRPGPRTVAPRWVSEGAGRVAGQPVRARRAGPDQRGPAPALAGRVEVHSTWLVDELGAARRALVPRAAVGNGVGCRPASRSCRAGPSSSSTVTGSPPVKRSPSVPPEGNPNQRKPAASSPTAAVAAATAKRRPEGFIAAIMWCSAAGRCPVTPVVGSTLCGVPAADDPEEATDRPATEAGTRDNPGCSNQPRCIGSSA